MLWWHTMRYAAIARHVIIWRMFDGGDPIKWQSHMSIIKSVYGY